MKGKSVITRALKKRGFPASEIRLHSGTMTYGYAMVSTDGQTVGTQVEAMSAAGAAKAFRETASGAKTNRVLHSQVLAELEAGDVLMVTRHGRLDRSTRELLNTVAAITDCEARLRSLGDTWADTTTHRTAS
jgi:DNA invertase Pin-like site-specific DNA recombinase